MEEIVLRDMIESDIEDYVKWFSTKMEWQKFDAPWEPISLDEAAERESWTSYFDAVKQLPKDKTRFKFEIEWCGKHIGWVSSYTDTSFVPITDESTIAVGIDIADDSSWGHGVGTIALKKFVDYLMTNGYRNVYIETWSGNAPMIKVALKLGFEEIFRQRNAREVDGKQYDSLTFALTNTALTTK